MGAAMHRPFQQALRPVASTVSNDLGYRDHDIPHPGTPTHIQNFKRLDVNVLIYDDETDELLADYNTNLANDGERRVFAEQMTNAYAGGQYSIVSPILSIPK